MPLDIEPHRVRSRSEVRVAMEPGQDLRVDPTVDQTSMDLGDVARHATVCLQAKDVGAEPDADVVFHLRLGDDSFVPAAGG